MLHDARAVDRLIGEVFRLYGAIVAAGDDVTRPFGLTSARWQIMGAIEATGGGTMSDLARRVGVTRQSVQRIVNEMVGEGQLGLRENPRHRRAKVIVMTDEGWRTYEAVTEAWRPTSERMDREFGVEALGEIVASLAALREGFGRATGVGRQRDATDEGVS